MLPLTIAAWILVSGAAVAQPVTVSIDPRETYLLTYNDPDAIAPGHAISLAALSIKPGDQLRLSVFGLVTWSNCGQPDCVMALPGGSGAFTSGGAPRDGVLATGLPQHITPTAGCGPLATDIPNDFILPGYTSITVTVPPGATTLWAAYQDCYYSDNRGTFTISIEKLAGLTAHLTPAEPRIPPAGTRGTATVAVEVSCNSPGTAYAWPFTVSLARATSANGGHDDATHTGARPLGTLTTSLALAGQETVSGTTTPGQTTLVMFRPPEVAGGVDLNLTCGSGQGVATTTARIDVRVSTTLVPLASTIATLESNNSHGTAGDHLQQAVRHAYLDVVTMFRTGPPYIGPWPGAKKVIETSGMSLPWGGRYDIDRDWVAPHKSHREGTSIDIRHKLLSPFERTWLNTLLLISGFKMVVAGERPTDPAATHWHAEWAPTPAVTSSSGRSSGSVCAPSRTVAVTVTPTVVQDASGYRYTYDVTVAANSPASMTAFAVNAPTPVTSSGGPPGWLSLPQQGVVAWAAPVSDPATGVPTPSIGPGQTARFAFTSPYGPGNVVFRAIDEAPIEEFATEEEGEDFLAACDATVAPTRGTTQGPVAPDRDGDGIADAVEVAYGLDPDNAAGNEGPFGDPDGDGVLTTDELARGTHPRGFVQRYFAEGATSALFSTRIALLNVGASAAHVQLRYQKPDATTTAQLVTIAPHSRATVDVGALPGLSVAEFATTIESDLPVVADRTVSWEGSRGYGAHAETALRAPSTSWFLAEGTTRGAFNLFYLLQNPNDVAATVRVRYIRPAGAPLTKTYTLPPHSRTNIWVNVEEFAGLGAALASTDVSAAFDSTNGQAVLVERALYLDVPGQFFGAGHESAGVTSPALSWFLAEGATGPFFDLFVLVANPSDGPAQVEASYLLPDGSSVEKTYTVAANSRFNIWVDYEDPRLADTAVSTTIRSVNGAPLVVERALWWPSPNWYEAHNSPGATTTGRVWAVAEGEVDARRNLDTYVLLSNPSATSADVRVTVMFEDGSTAEQTFTGIAPRSRFNVPIGSLFPSAAGRRFGVLVESLGQPGTPLVVEWSMYWDAAGQTWAAGTNALATKIQ